MGVCPCFKQSHQESVREKESSMQSYKSERGIPSLKYPSTLINFQNLNTNFFHHLEQYEQIKQTLNLILTQTPQSQWYKHESQLINYQENLEKYIQKLKQNLENENLQEKKSLFIEFYSVQIHDKIHLQSRYFSPQIHIFLLDKSQKKYEQYKSNRPDKTNITLPVQNHNYQELMEFTLKNLETHSQKSLDNSRFYYGTDKQSFQLQLTMYDKVKGKDVQIGSSQIFSLSELKDQQVHSLKINFKNQQGSETYAQLEMRCQLIFSYRKFYEYWEQEIKARTKQINKVLQKLQENPELRAERVSQYQRSENNFSSCKYSAKTVDIIESLASNNSYNQISIRKDNDDNDSYYDGGFQIK